MQPPSVRNPKALAAEWAHELDRHEVSRGGTDRQRSRHAGGHGGSGGRLPGTVLSATRWLAIRGTGSRKHFRAFTWRALFPAMHRYALHEECVAPVFEWAAAERRAVFVHCGVQRVGVRDKLGLASPFDLRYSNPVDVHALALRYPDVPIVIPHFGAGYFREALMVASLVSQRVPGHVELESMGAVPGRPSGSAAGVPAGTGRGVGPQARGCFLERDSSFFPRWLALRDFRGAGQGAV